jgi:polysaccharide biosynthesis transport protein
VAPVFIERPAGHQRQAGSGDLDREFIGLRDITTFLRQYARSTAAFVAAGIIGALFYITTTDPIFTARTQIMIEPKLPQFLQQTGGVSTSLDTAQIESQITVMRSEKIAQMVIDQLGLMDHPDFMRLVKPTMLDRLRMFATAMLKMSGFKDGPGWLVGAKPGAQDGAPPDDAAPAPQLTEFELTRRAIALLQGNLDIRRNGVSYAVDIWAKSRNPDLAADIANATADTLLREQIETKAAAARQGGEWMEGRLDELRKQMNTATQIAQEFRARHDYRVRPPGAELVEGQIVYEEASDPEGPTLEELELTADTYRKMYESFLQAFTSNLSQQSYPVADARVITTATRPLSPTHPRKKLLLAFGVFAGAMLGVGVAFLRNTLDRSVRSPRQIREEFGLDCIAELPAVRGRNGGFGLPDEVALAPKGSFSENLKRAKAAIGLGTGDEAMRCIGVVSALPGEGKSTCASNLALLYSMAGLRTLLIDADAEHSVLTTRFVTSGAARPADGRAPQKSVTNGIVPTANRCMDLLPGTSPDAKGLLSTRHLEAALADLHCYDIVIFDLPPLTSGADKLSIARALDGVIVVAEWGSTPVDLIRELVVTLQASKTPIIGILLTKVRMLSRKPYRRNRFRPPR